MATPQDRRTSLPPTWSDDMDYTDTTPEAIDEQNDHFSVGEYTAHGLYYDSDSGDLEIAPDYPLMSPVSHNFDDLQFLHEPVPGDWMLRIVNPDGTEFIIENLNPAIIGRVCSSLACAFVQVPSIGKRVFTLHFPQTPVIGFLRGIYQGDYTFCEAMLERRVPLLLHLQVLYLSIKFRNEEMAMQARSYATKEVDSPSKSDRLPVLELCESIRFLYTELRHCHDLRRALANYCLKHFEQHYGEDFRQTAYESPAFHRDLQHANYVDDFQERYAGDITRLPVCQHLTHKNDMDAWQGANDFTCQFHSEIDFRYSRSAELAPLTVGSFMQAEDVPVIPLNPYTTPRVSALLYQESRPNRGSLDFTKSAPNVSFNPSVTPADNSLLGQAIRSSKEPKISRFEPQRLVFRTATPWLPDEEQAVNNSASAHVTSKAQEEVERTNESCLERRNQATPTPDKSRTTFQDRPKSDALRSSDSSLYEWESALRSSSEDGEDFSNLASLLQDSPTAEPSDSEWAMVDAPRAYCEPGGSQEGEEVSMSDSEWSEIELPAAIRE